MINRDEYIEKIKPLIDVNVVKILTGIRRSGKSTILEMIKNEIVNNGIKEDFIIFHKYSDMEYEDYSSKDMYKQIKEEMKEKTRYYLFLDEVQEIEGWEKVVNHFFENENVDIYVTGSNSKLMSSEISSYLSGRYVSIPVYTVSFQEWLTFKNKNLSDRELLEEYILYGGFPLIASNSFDRSTTYQIVQGIYNTVITQDISRRHSIKNQELFDRTVRYIVENVGRVFSANSIVKFLKNEKRSLSVETIYNYLTWLKEAFIIYPCMRYDIKGKDVLQFQEKYYLADVSLKYALFGYNRTMIAEMLENIVYLELKRRQYDVYVGKLDNKEIDFVAIKNDEKIYIQVCYEMPIHSEREVNNLKEIKDHCHKYVVTMDRLSLGQVDGIDIVSAEDFLTRERY